MSAASASEMIFWSRSIVACAFDAAMSSRHSLLSKLIDALMRVIKSAGLISKRPPQVRCAGGFSAMFAGHLDRGDPNGTRTRVFAVKGRRPRPLDDGAAPRSGVRVRRGAKSGQATPASSKSSILKVHLGRIAAVPFIALDRS